MVDGVTGKLGLIAPKSVAREQSLEQDPVQTQDLNTAGKVAQGKAKK